MSDFIKCMLYLTLFFLGVVAAFLIFDPAVVALGLLLGGTAIALLMYFEHREKQNRRIVFFLNIRKE